MGVFAMSQVLVNFRMDEEDKKGMEEVCKELGLSMTTAFTLLAKKMRREKRIPFEVSIDPFVVHYIEDWGLKTVQNSTTSKKNSNESDSFIEKRKNEGIPEM